VDPHISYVYDPMSDASTQEQSHADGHIMYEDGQKVFVPPPPKYRSIFERFYYVEDGVISISLKDMTLVGTLAITGFLLFILYRSCTTLAECGEDYVPMVSAIIALPLYDRITCLLFTFYAFTVMQANVRCYYKMFYGIAHPFKLDLIMFLGVVSCVSLVMIAFFDMYVWGFIHNPTAVVFFVSASFNTGFIAYEMKFHKDKFPAEEHAMIDKCYMWCIATIVTAVTMGISLGMWGVHYWAGPTFEWLSVIMLLNFYNMACMVNPYYSSITDPSKLATPEKYIR
jgi:hypothetical protein